MPDGHDKKTRNQQWRALGYLISGLIILACLFIAYDSRWWFIPALVQWWWIWASITGLDRK